MKYRFYLNDQKDAEGRNLGFFGYQPGHALRLVRSGEVLVNNPRLALELLFEQFNIDHPADYRDRSMSVGDVVMIDDTAFACESTGWKQISVTYACAVCGVSGPEHGHYDARNPDTHKFVCGRLTNEVAAQ